MSIPYEQGVTVTDVLPVFGYVPTFGRMTGMAKAKLSVTLDAAKVAQARALVDASTVSEVISLALDRLITYELERRHVAGYLRRPPGQDDDAWAEVLRQPDGIVDDVDWARLYGVEPAG